jgi:hypothetical protein
MMIEKLELPGLFDKLVHLVKPLDCIIPFRKLRLEYCHSASALYPLAKLPERHAFLKLLDCFTEEIRPPTDIFRPHKRFFPAWKSLLSPVQLRNDIPDLVTCHSFTISRNS